MATYIGNMFRYTLCEYTQNILKMPITISCSLQTKLNALVPYRLCKFYIYLGQSTYFRAYRHYLRYQNNYKTWHFINPKWIRQKKCFIWSFWYTCIHILWGRSDLALQQKTYLYSKWDQLQVLVPLHLRILGTISLLNWQKPTSNKNPQVRQAGLFRQ